MFKSCNAFIVFLVLSILGLSGCMVANIHSNSNVGKLSSVEDARAEIKKGMSMDEVVAKWGEPNNRSTTNDRTVWNYGHKTFSADPVAYVTNSKREIVKVVGVTFINGKVTNVEYREKQKN